MVGGNSDANISSGGGVRSSASGSRRSAVPDPLLGTLVADRYRILELVGRGGMGVVYKARHEMMERTVAIKMLLPQLLSDENAVPRFQREARAASKINHPNIMALHDFGRTPDGMPYLVMDYIEGESLADILKREGQLGVQRCTHIFSQVCDALAHAHELGIIHRDLKPGNIMLVQTEDARDVVKVVDFGVAKMYETDDETEMQRLTTTGELFGSPVYMSPEQCSGQELDQRSDIYALGCVMYETLTGKLPCAGKTVLETISKQLNSMPALFSDARPDLYIPEWIEVIVFRALQKDVGRRQQTMKDVQNELSIGAAAGNSTAQMKALSSQSIKTRALTSGRSMPAVQPSAGTAFGDWKKYAVVGGGLALGLIVTCLVAFALLRKPPEPPTPTPSPQPQPVGKKDPPPVQPVKKDPPPVADDPAPQPPPKKVVAPPKTHTSTPVAHAPTKHTTSHKTGEAPPPPMPSSRKHIRDFYDYARTHENHTGDPEALPIKDWSPD